METKPKDTYNFIYWSMTFFGILCLLPWDIVVTVSAYWKEKFKDGNANDTVANSDDSLNSLQKEFETYLNIAAGAASAPIVVSHLFIGHYVSVYRKSLITLTGVSIFLASMAVFAFLDTSDWQNSLITVSLVHIVLLNVCRSAFRASNSVNMGKFPVEHMSAINIGLSMAGLIAVLINIAVLVTDVDIEVTGGICFITVSGMALLGIILLSILQRNHFYQYYTNLPQTTNPDMKLFSLTFWGELAHSFQGCWIYMLANFISFVTTNALYPGVVHLIKQAEEEPSLDGPIYTQLVVFLNFNIANTLGSIVAGIVQWPGNPSVRSQLILLALAIIRLGLVPVILFSNISPGNRASEIWLTDDWAFIVTFGILAFTDGYILNNVMMFGPKAGKACNQEITASMLVAAQPVTVFIASVISNVIVKNL